MRLAEFILMFALGSASALGENGIAYNRDIRPILAESCFECHGPAKSKGGLRLDLESSATNTLKSGAVAIRPGEPSKSEVLLRLRSSDPDEQMPPPTSAKARLSETKIALIERWISEGARYEQHWAFAKITRPAPPARMEPSANPIDAFIEKRATDAGLALAPRASERILRRRLAFDLTGLPPGPVAENLDWDREVDRLLAAPAYGERMAVWWLDLVRYADTEGYFSDSYRNIYPYRDYVVRAFNANKPFDQFTIEQLAGDLVPGATWEQKVASGYNRLILTTHEDGANEAEYRARYAADRVRNLGSVWLGMTLGCAQCHDHKFDPISAAEFYRTAAFFADIKEEAVDEQPETFVVPDSSEYRDLLQRIAAVQRELQGGLISSTCALMGAEEELLRTGKTPDAWPHSKKTAEMIVALRRDAEGCASPKEQKEVARYFKIHYFRVLNIELSHLTSLRAKFETNGPPTLVTERGPIQPVRILPRGDWLDHSRPELQPRFPGFGANLPEPPSRLTRLDLARWLVVRENPLTARVIVNRLWQLFFEQGLARSVDDFGVQGEAPSNPELLDWLASEFIDSGWDIKHVVRLIVTSDAYRRSSKATEEALEKDPNNRLFARQNRAPLAAEFVRDNALAISGLLVQGMGGRPVKPYLPERFKTMEEIPYEIESTDRLYRRGLYLYRKRSNLNPALAAFNASTREECVSARSVSASPRAALAALNAPQYIEAARAFAERIYLAGDCDAARFKVAFQFALERDPTAAEVEILSHMLESDRATFSKNRFTAARFIRTGNYRWPASIDAVELASWTSVARAILNLEETNTRY